MVEVNHEIVGLRELAKNIDKLKPAFARSTLRTALRNAAKPVAVDAKANVVVDQGNLRRNIRVNASVKRSGRGQADIGVTPAAFYGTLIELGTSTQPAQPFLRPAIERKDADGSIRNAFVDALNKTIAKVLGRLR